MYPSFGIGRRSHRIQQYGNIWSTQPFRSHQHSVRRKGQQKPPDTQYRIHKGLSTHRNRQYDGFFGHHRTGRSQARPGNSSSRRTQRDNDRTSRRREEFTGQGYGGHSASYGTGRGSSDKQNLFCRRQGMAKARTQQTQTIQVTSLQRVGSRASRRRFGQYTSGRNIPCAQWGPVP